MKAGRFYLCALLAALSFAAAVHLHPAFAWILSIPIVLALAARPGMHHAATFGALFGVLAIAATHLLWISSAVAAYFPLAPASAVLVTSAVTLVLAACLGAVLGLLARAAVSLGGATAALAFGCAWVLWESCCISVLPFYPWASLAVTQARWVEVLQIARWLGASAVSFCVAAAGAASGLALCARSRSEGPVLWLVAVGLVSALPIIGRLALTQNNDDLQRSRCTVRTIDASIPSGALRRDDVLRSYQTATERFLDANHPDAVVWPESALPASPEIDRRLREWLRERAGEWRSVIVAGGPGNAWGAGWEAKSFNSVYRIDAKGPIERYDKRRLVPFAEYWPAVGVSRPTWLQADETAAGNRAALFPIGACRLGVLVCFEGDDDDAARRLVRAGADGLLVVSNDAFLPPAASELEIAQLRLRAVETGVSVVRAANHGPSAIIDRDGRLLQSSSGSTLLASIPKSPAAVPALLYASLFRFLCHAVALLALAASAVRQRRAEEGTTEQELSKLST